MKIKQTLLSLAISMLIGSAANASTISVDESNLNTSITTNVSK